MIAKLSKATCKGGWLRRVGLGHSEHFFSHDYGGTDKCWRGGCNAEWDSFTMPEGLT